MYKLCNYGVYSLCGSKEEKSRCGLKLPGGLGRLNI
jgi:hypothetical protein